MLLSIHVGIHHPDMPFGSSPGGFVLRAYSSDIIPCLQVDSVMTLLPAPPANIHSESSPPEPRRKFTSLLVYPGRGQPSPSPINDPAGRRLDGAAPGRCRVSVSAHDDPTTPRRCSALAAGGLLSLGGSSNAITPRAKPVATSFSCQTKETPARSSLRNRAPGQASRNVRVNTGLAGSQ